ncbi:hypothetical protein MMC30_001650 [Trapelia coarctata]|nr:hypothetical protein [Trapelia coarctata]
MKGSADGSGPNQDVELDRRLQMMASELDSLRKEKEKLVYDHSAVEVENKHLKEMNLKAEQDMQQLKLHANILQHELQACRDDLFRLQPIVQVTDAEIVKQFEHVCEQISSWVDEEISSFETRAGALENGTRFILECGGSEIRAMLQKNPQASEYLIGYVIHQHLQRRVLGKHVYLFGLTPDETTFLRTAEKKMAKLDPPRDNTTIRNWRSETLKALANDKRMQVVGQDVANEIFRVLEQIFPIVRGQRESFMRLYERIIVPAIKLAIDIQVSSALYRFLPDSLEELVLECGKVRIDALKQVGMIDVKTRKTLRLDSPVVADEQGYIGKLLFLVEPQLLRRNDVPEKTTYLRQAMYLVELFHPLEKRK